MFHNGKNLLCFLPNVKTYILIGIFIIYTQVHITCCHFQVGGTEEYDIVTAMKEKKITKPLVAWCIGTCAKMFTSEVGHSLLYYQNTTVSLAIRMKILTNYECFFTQTGIDMVLICCPPCILGELSPLDMLACIIFNHSPQNIDQSMYGCGSLSCWVIQQQS